MRPNTRLNAVSLILMAHIKSADPPETDAEGNSRFFSFASTPGEASARLQRKP